MYRKYSGTDRIIQLSKIFRIMVIFYPVIYKPENIIRVFVKKQSLFLQNPRKDKPQRTQSFNISLRYFSETSAIFAVK